MMKLLWFPFFHHLTTSLSLGPWYDEKPSIDILAKYRRAESSELVVELWQGGKGFELHLTFEFSYMLDIQHRDSLVHGITRFKEDDFLYEYYHYFELLKHYLKTGPEPPAEADGKKLCGFT